jgi:hypothetical protein
MKKWLINHEGAPAPEVFFGLRGYDSPIVVDTLTKNAWYYHPERGVQKLKFKVQPALTEFPTDKPVVIDVRYSEGLPGAEVFGNSRGRGAPVVIDRTSDKAYYLNALSEVKEMTGGLAFDTGIRFGDRYLLAVPGARTIFTSQPYPVAVIESMDVVGSFSSGALIAWPIELMDVAGSFTSGSITTVQQFYTFWPVESVDISGAFTSGNLVTVQLFYNFWPVESMDISGAFSSGSLTVVQITYNFWPIESMDITGAFVSGTLS